MRSNQGRPSRVISCNVELPDIQPFRDSTRLCLLGSTSEESRTGRRSYRPRYAPRFHCAARRCPLDASRVHILVDVDEVVTEHPLSQIVRNIKHESGELEDPQARERPTIANTGA